MSLNAASIPVGASYSPSGGSATSMVSLGQTPGENQLFLDDGSDLILRRLCTATSKPPQPSSGAPNGYTQQRLTLFWKIPLLLDNGNYTTNTVKIELRFDPETDSSERAFMRELLTHAGADADFTDFFDDGSVV